MPEDYEVLIAPSAKRELEHLHDPVLKRVVDAIAALGSEPRPRGCRKLEGAASDYRVRVGDYRVVYTVDDAERRIMVFRIRHRNKAYS